jgi:pilus assembly protein CpaF
MEVDQICIQDLFVYRQTGLSREGHAQGHFEACGVRPHVLNRIHAEGIELSPDLFKRRRLESAKSVL